MLLLVFSFMPPSTLAQIRAHAVKCRTNGCPCKKYVANRNQWAQHFTILDDGPQSDDGAQSDDTWLWHNIDAHGKVSITCVVCGMKLPCHFASLRRHHQSASHLKSIATFLGKPLQYVAFTAPLVESFKQMFCAFHEGRAARSGFDLPSGHVGRTKANLMLWCLNEALLERDREFLVQSSCLMIMRDERRGRLHFRFRGASSLLIVSAGYLGQSVGHTPDALGIRDATMQVIKRFCTRRSNPPPGSKLETCFDTSLCDRMLSCLEAVSVDSASNEVCAVTDMKSLAPNCQHLLRDAAHSARRLLQRLWHADEVLEGCLGFFCHWKDSLSQLVHHSLEMRQLYSECTAESDECAVTTKFQHMRSAKHRVETFMTPLSRCVLDLTALLAFATKLCVLRSGQRAGKAAGVFLNAICPQLILLAALMADAGSEVLLLVRILDNEELTIVILCGAIDDFLKRVTWLFFEDGCFQVDGHTKFAVEWLRAPHFVSDRGVGKCIGGIDLMADAYSSMRSAALAHLRSWVELAKHTLEAEFPSFSLVMAFSAFDLPRWDMNPLNPTRAKHLQRLSHTFKQKHLQREFVNNWRYALHAFTESDRKCSAWQAWQEAVGKAERAGRECSQLKFVIQRGLVFVPATSGVEQSFSLVDSKLDENRLHGSSDAEDLAVRLLVVKLTPHEEDVVSAKAAEIWRSAFMRHSRTHTRPRTDKGLRCVCGSAASSSSPSKPAIGKLSEKHFLRSLREQVGMKCAGSVAAASSSSIAPMVWTEKHEKEKQFQLEKQRKRMVEALLFLLFPTIFALFAGACPGSISSTGHAPAASHRRVVKK